MTSDEKKEYCEQLVVQSRIEMLEKHPFVASLALRLPIVVEVEPSYRTARTNGRRIAVNADYFIGLSRDERMGIVAHEVWHCAMRHHQRLGDRNLERFNYACDIETDLILTADGFVIDMLPYQDDWVGQPAEWIYERIPDELAQLDCDNDEHVYAQPKKLNNLPAPGVNQSGKGQDSGEDVQNDGEKSSDGAVGAGEEGGQAGGSDGDAGDEEEVDWDSILAENAKKLKKAGKLSGHFDSFVQASDTEVQDWKSILANYLTMFIKGDRDWIPPNRRYVHRKLYMPGRKRLPKISLVLAIDTSGSTTDYLADFVAELQGICNSFGEYEVTVLQCDTRVTDVKKYDNETPWSPEGLEMRGLGGTNLCPPFTYISNHPELDVQLFLYLTDGFGTAPASEPAYPVLWCLTADGERPADWGLEVRLNTKAT